LAPLNGGGLNSTHIHGTSVPVEEPSTASKADIVEQFVPGWWHDAGVRSAPVHLFGYAVKM
jgi:hypothetical protein